MKSLIFLMLGAALLSAQAGVTVSITNVDARLKEPVALHLFGGRPAEFNLEIAAEAQARGVNLRATLYQLAGTLAAPLAKDLPVARDLVLTEEPNRREKFTVDVPEVRQTTLMELRFSAQREPDGPWQSAGTARIIVHPADLLAQAKAMLLGAEEKAGVKLAVLGESPRLKAILQGAGIGFEPVNADALANSGRRIFLGEFDRRDASDLAARNSGALLLFTSDPTLPAGVYWNARQGGAGNELQGGFVAKVTLPLLANFERSPDQQVLFISLIDRAISSFSPNP